jgi:D-alanyl-D-alanine carboxypeptidase
MADKKEQLRTLIQQYEARNHRQMGVAILVGTAILGGAILFAPRPVPEAAPIIVEESPVPARNSYEGVMLTGKAAVVYDLATGEVLFERNAKAQLPLASLTKLLTVYAAATSLPQESKVTITEEALAADGESGFSAGETFVFDDLARLARSSHRVTTRRRRSRLRPKPGARSRVRISLRAPRQRSGCRRPMP